MLSLMIDRGQRHALSCVLMAWLLPVAAAAAGQPYEGRPVAEVLRAFQAQGVKVVFSDALVKPAMRVEREPASGTARAIISEILAPHGLGVSDGRGETLLVIRAKAPTKVVSEPAPAIPVRGTGAIEGVVLNQQTRQPVHMAIVSIDATGVSTTTVTDGRFRLDDVAVGVHAIRVDAVDHESTTYPELKVTPGRTAQVVVELQAISSFSETVTVTAAAAPRPANVTASHYNLANEEIRRSAGSLNDVNRFVQALPGLAALGDIRNDLVARGGSPSENLILVDGFEAPSLSHFSQVGSAGGIASVLNNDLLADATFLAGGFPAEYGDRLSSVLDIRLREGHRQRFALEADVNFAGVSVVAEGPIGGRGSWITSFRRSYLDLFVSSAGTETVPRMGAYTFKASYDIGERHKIWALALGGVEDIRFNFDDDNADDPDFVGVDLFGWRLVTGLAWQHLIRKSAFGVLSVSNAFSGQDVSAHDRLLGADDLVLRDKSLNGETTLKYDLSWQPSAAVAVRGGWQTKGYWRDLYITQPRGVQLPHSILPREQVPGITIDLPGDGAEGLDTTTSTNAAHLQATFRVLPRTAVTTGIRVEHFEVLDQTTVSPRIGVETRIAPRVTVSAAAGRYYQQPELLAVVAVPGNDVLDPIRADHLVGGVRIEPRPDLWLSAEVYGKWYQGYPVSRDYPSLTFANHGADFEGSEILLLPLTSAGGGQAIGVELFAKKRFTSGVYGQVAYTVSKSEHEGGDGVLRASSFDTTHVLSAVGGYRLGANWDLSGRVTVASGRPYTPPLLPQSFDQNRFIYDVSRFNRERLRPFHRIDVRLDRNFRMFGKSAAAFLEVLNATNSGATIAIDWNQRTRALHEVKQLEILPILGFNLKF